MKIPEETIKGTLDLVKLVLVFGRTYRVTHHEDGETLESDTDHTVMLGMLACAFAEQFAPHLDRGKIAQFALIHDFAEVYAQDTSTFGMTDEVELKAKEEREAQALKRIRTEFDHIYPWIGETIEQYENLDTPEARFVKVIDKALPKMLHVLNGGVSMETMNYTKEMAEDYHIFQVEKIAAGYGSDVPEAMVLLRETIDVMHEKLYGKRLLD